MSKPGRTRGLPAVARGRGQGSCGDSVFHPGHLGGCSPCKSRGECYPVLYELKTMQNCMLAVNVLL